jgi:hypothetical protein
MQENDIIFTLEHTEPILVLNPKNNSFFSSQFLF